MQKKDKLLRHYDFCTAGNIANAIHSKSQSKLTRQLPIMWLRYLHHAQQCTTMSWFCEIIDPFVAAGVRFSCLTCKKCSWLAKILYCFHTPKKTTQPSKRVKRYRTQMTTHNAGPSKPRFAEFAIQQSLFPRCLFRELPSSSSQQEILVNKSETLTHIINMNMANYIYTLVTNVSV